MQKTAFIMAGGRGERFWPRSRKTMPKQFLSLTEDGKTMIQLTVERILPLVKIEDIFISTNKEYKDLVLNQLPTLPEENILCEPLSRNTAPCIGLGAIHILNKYKDALMIVLPSDHLIKYNSMFLSTVEEACLIAEQKSQLVTIGITPNYPETGYGYIKFNPKKNLNRGYEVERFIEKPTLEHAKEYLETEKYLWNSGMFVWKVSSILYQFQQLLPNVYEGLLRIENRNDNEDRQRQIEKEFEQFPSVSIDYGIMEKAKEIYTIPGTFGWDDLGSWLAVERTQRTDEFGNIIHGNIITIDSRNCIIEGENKLIAAVGVKDMIIIDSKDAILICQKDSANNIKKVLDNLKICNRYEYL